MTRVDAALAALTARMRLPAIVAPMFLVSGPRLVVASCRAGLIGAFPGPNARSIEELDAWFAEIDAALGPDDAPFAFNMLTHSSYGRFEAELALVARYRPALVITALGGPQRVVATVRDYGGLVFADVNTPDYARKAVARGADGLVLVCAGAGGHTGAAAMPAFLDEVRSFFDGPVVAGGAISQGRGIRAAEVMGADFAYLGTRFIACPESLANEEYRGMLLRARLADIRETRAITGAPANFLRESLERAGIGAEALKAEAKLDFSGDMLNDAKAWKHIWGAGQGVGAIRRIEPVPEVVDGLVQGYLDAVAAERGRLAVFPNRLQEQRA
jgi:nitronate monooxygenase